MEDALGGMSAREDERALARIKAWNCRAFHKASYDPRHATLAWVGDISMEQARTFTQRIVDGWKPLPAVKQSATANVITSYSIHYTKLYEAISSCAKEPARSGTPPM